MLNFEKRVEFIDMNDVYDLEFEEDMDHEDTCKKLAPWAKAFVRCGGGFQAFESKKEAKQWENLV